MLHKVMFFMYFIMFMLTVVTLISDLLTYSIITQQYIFCIHKANICFGQSVHYAIINFAPVVTPVKLFCSFLGSTFMVYCRSAL